MAGDCAWVAQNWASRTTSPSTPRWIESFCWSSAMRDACSKSLAAAPPSRASARQPRPREPVAQEVLDRKDQESPVRAVEGTGPDHREIRIERAQLCLL